MPASGSAAGICTEAFKDRQDIFDTAIRFVTMPQSFFCDVRTSIVILYSTSEKLKTKFLDFF